ncbi:hypothetical protein GCM10009560_62600 [Nonomuraea longicatena]|uniref:Uncharacterized protein n=1 Tax=Nonomuraea longicatena TaxID=83682 RepID=A0ABN1QS56_9ACTN
MSPGLALIIWQCLPNLVAYPGDDTLTLVAGDSWAEVGLCEPTLVNHGGPRDLWAVVEDARNRWEAAGRPGIERFGITVEPDRQWVWLDSPVGAVTC